MEQNENEIDISFLGNKEVRVITILGGIKETIAYYQLHRSFINLYFIGHKTNSKLIDFISSLSVNISEVAEIRMLRVLNRLGGDEALINFYIENGTFIGFPNVGIKTNKLLCNYAKYKILARDQNEEGGKPNIKEVVKKSAPKLSLNPKLRNINTDKLLEEYKSGETISILEKKYKIPYRLLMQVLSPGREEIDHFKKMNKTYTWQKNLVPFIAWTKELNYIPALVLVMKKYGITNKIHYYKLKQEAEKQGFKLLPRKQKIALREQENSIKRKEVIAYLKELAERIGHAPSLVEMKDDNKYYSDLFTKVFKSCKKANELVKLMPEISNTNFETYMPKPHVNSEQDIINDLMQLRQTLGHKPTKKDIKEKGKYHNETYIRILGSKLEEYITRVAKPRRDITETLRVEMIDNLKLLAIKLGRTPRAKDLTNKEKFNAKLYIRVFGSLSKANYAAETKPFKLGESSGSRKAVG